MNPNDIQKLKNAVEDIRLTAAEKASMRSELLHFMHSDAPSKGAVPQATPSFFMSVFMIRARVGVALMLLLIVGGSTASAAQGAVPGDLLYGMKVGVNEKVESALALSEESKIDVEAMHATRRLVEAEVLLSRGTLSPQESVRLKQRFSANADAVEKEIIHLRSKGKNSAADKLHAKVEKDLGAHLETAVLLSDDSVEATNTRPIVREIVRSLVEKRNAEFKSKKEREGKKEKGKHESSSGRSDTKIESTTVVVPAAEVTTATSSASVEVSHSNDRTDKGVWGQVKTILSNQKHGNKEKWPSNQSGR